MGTNDSSRTRVAPVFDWLIAHDATGQSWVDRLLALGSRSEVMPSLPVQQSLIAAHGRRWGTNERGLYAPQSLLEHLVRNVDPKLVESAGDSGTTLVKRQALAAKDDRTIADAIGQIRAGKRGRRWFVLEGESRPDALIETNDLVICVEGKRTEAGCTTATTWMPRRSQLVRHMDAALEFFPEKRILGLLIVEGDGDGSARTPSDFWKAESAAQYAPAMLADSLPHREAIDRDKIASGMLGVTTWQAVCAEFGIPWPPSPDVI